MIAELVWAIPFVLLLGAIAVLPLLKKHWWEANYPFVSIILGAIVVAHYLFGLKDTEILLHTAHEYVSFIALIGSLFVVAGGIHIRVKGEATPISNCVFLFIGAVMANFIGTTGASMILIRPWIRMNKYRITSFHVVFFIFLVSNIGGGLTPIGDPPLFLGYLRGVPFFWVLENVWAIWLLAIGILLVIFYVVDTRNFKRAPKEIRQKETAGGEEWRFEGMSNLFFLTVIIASVFINDPPFLREALMIAAAVLSYKTTKKSVHESNDFNFAPIKEVAILFLGIFATMIPALQWLEHNSASIGLTSVSQFYWGSGILSSVLDNAPTYLNFLSAAIGIFLSPDLVSNVQHLIQSRGADMFGGAATYSQEIRNTFEVLARYHADLVAQNHVPIEDIHVSMLLANHPNYIRAISVASVFFGAMTYIGNGPNFLVKSIADQSKVHMPSFFGYVFRYSVPFLLPVLIVVWWVFFRTAAG